ncbi:MAG: sigma factor [Planctomycetota bacterium]|nr:sigma factor [Planctomycetota bacterium]
MTRVTCWTMIEDASSGDEGARGRFASMYLPVVRAYIAARWKGSALVGELDDAVQEVFLECFRGGGALERADRDQGGFRPYLYGLVRNVARRVEERRERAGNQRHLESLGPVDVESNEESLSKVFDRAWAGAVMRRAAERQRAMAEAAGEPERRRIELLRLHFREGHPIRAIARRWDEDSHRLQREYVKAQEEFRRALIEEVGFDQPGPPAAAECECDRLLELLA